MVHAISLIIPQAICNVEKTLIAGGKKRLDLEEVGKVKTNKSIAERINCSVMTEVGEIVRIFGKTLQRGNVSLIAVVLTYFSMHNRK